MHQRYAGDFMDVEPPGGVPVAAVVPPLPPDAPSVEGTTAAGRSRSAVPWHSWAILTPLA